MSLGNIEHVVVLMLENRSFDSLLGYLYETDAPQLNIPAVAQGDEFHGLAHTDLTKFVNTALNGTLSSPPVRGVEGFTVPTPDPGEEFSHVNTQLFGTPNPLPSAVPTMTGVLADFVEVMQELSYSAADINLRAPSIMQSYTQAQLPVLNQLARHYAVSDEWFASVPSQTNPNRAFAMCGTSHGLVNNGELEEDPRAQAIEKILGMRIGDDRFPDRTIFNAVNDAGRDWKVFWQTSYLPEKMSKLIAAANSIPLLPNPVIIALKALLLALGPYSSYLTELSSGELSSNYTWRLFQAIQQIPDAESHFAKLDQFHAMARSGTLPAFSYIEPFWTISQSGTDTGLKRVVTAMGNDYHPPGNMLVGEDFVTDVYESLIANRDAWSKTALLITFDEFVGSFDHVGPPSAVPPWGQGGKPGFLSPTGFKFDRLGARVPTILVSPYVQKGTVFRSSTDVAYDHSSIIATTLEWLGIGNQSATFGQRTAQAPTFDDVLVLDEPRTDEHALAFLDTGRSIGDLLSYGDQFVMQNANGSYLAAFQQESKSAAIPDVLHDFAVDLGMAANFPTLGGSGVSLVFQTSKPDGGPVNDGDRLWLVSKEAGLVADNVLGAWADSHDVYWYDLFLDGDNADKQSWTVQKVDSPGAPLRFGDRVRLVNHSYNQGLCQDGRPWQGTWITTSGSGDAWTIQPAIAPSVTLSTVAASQQGGSRGAQLWGVDLSGQLRSTFQESPGGPWSAWSGVWADASPANALSVAAAQQNDGRVQIWVVDSNHQLYSNAQTSPGGNWGGWSAPNWWNAPPLRLVTASQQGGSRGAQVWGVDLNGQLRSTYQATPGGSWSPWSGVWNGASPANVISLTAAQQNDGRVQIWVVDSNNTLYSNAQTSPGGNWGGWSPPNWWNSPPLRLVTASQQGGSRGAQLWGVDLNGQLRSTFQETPGGSWSPWSGVWAGASPANAISLTAAQQNNGVVRIWLVDANHVLYSNAQTSPGSDWTGWARH
jgi:phospholipase C